LGAFNRKARVIPKTHMADQLSQLVTALNDSTSKHGELLCQVRQFNFAEITGAMSEKGFCYIKADIYAKTSHGYRHTVGMDTVIFIKAMDVTRALFRKASAALNSLIATSLTKEPENGVDYSFNDILHIDSIEKRKIPVYNTDTYADGLYETYTSFNNQQPDKKITAEIKNGALSGVKAEDENGKMEKVKAKDIYAIVYEGKPFIATDYGYYPLHKINDDLLFTGKAKVTAKTGDVIAAGVFFGLLGTLIASNAEATFQMKLDHSNGGFIRLREVPRP
jgi:hypothetical protein